MSVCYLKGDLPFFTVEIQFLDKMRPARINKCRSAQVKDHNLQLGSFGNYFFPDDMMNVGCIKVQEGRFNPEKQDVRQCFVVGMPFKVGVAVGARASIAI